MLNTLNINLKTDIKNDRPTALGIKIMSQDKNNNQFILRFTNGGEPVNLDHTYTVEILTKFSNSGASRLTSATVRQDYATWEFDTAYITQDERVDNFVYVRKSGNLVVSADANAFYFDVGLSEIDKDAGRVAEVYDENYQKYLDEFKDNVDFEEIAQAEQARKDAEALREENYNQKVDTAIVEADVVTKVDNKVTELTPQISNLTAQLAQNASNLKNMANADEVLKIVNPYGNYENIHPKVLYFESGWMGYKFWMGYTPYPKGDIKKENPMIAVSNNGIDWGVPTGSYNVVIEDWNGVANEYNNDTHLVYRSDLNRLELWWRFTSVPQGINRLYRKTTLNGINWSSKELLHEGAMNNDHISPAVIFEDGKYKMISTNTQGSGRTLNYSESTDALNWSSRTEVNTDWGNLTPWHNDFIKDGSTYKMVIQAFVDSNNEASLYYLESTDLINWSNPIEILRPTGLAKGFDNKGIYRSSIVKVNDVYYVYYSSVSSDNTRAMALSYGKDSTALKGYVDKSTTDDKFVDLYTGGTFSNYDVKGKDLIYIRNSELTTFQSFVGGYKGQVIRVVCGSSSAKVTFNYNSRLITPSNKNYLLNPGNVGVVLICTDPGTHTWRLMAETVVNEKEFYGNEVLTNYDVSNVTFIQAKSNITLNSLSGGYRGQVIDLIIGSTGSTVDIKYSSSMLTPSGVDFLLDASKMGVRLICSNNNNAWRVVI